MEPPRLFCTPLCIARAHAKKVDCDEGDPESVTPPARGLPSATLPAEARAALALRADPATGRFVGASSIAALLFLLDRARDGDGEAARLALAVLRPLSWGVLAAHPPDPPSRLPRRRSEFAAADLAGPLRGPGASE